MSAAEWIILLSTGLLASVLAGVLGMGGGVLLLGVMSAILPPPVIVPLHAIVQLVSNFTRMLGLVRHVEWRIVAVFSPPLVIGVGAAMALWSGDKLTFLRPGIGLFLLVFLVLRRKAPTLRNPPAWSYAVLGVVVGFASVWIGAVGPLLAPFFLRDDFEPKQVIATKAACVSVSHLLKIPAFLLLGFDFLAHGPLVLGLVVAVVVGTLIGRAILDKLPRERFVTLFEILLGLLALWLIVSAAL